MKPILLDFTWNEEKKNLLIKNYTKFALNIKHRLESADKLSSIVSHNDLDRIFIQIDIKSRFRLIQLEHGISLGILIVYF